jgi:hypothetical protein
LGDILDNRIRKNEICIVNLPSCGYVFSSSPSCFIAYGFHRSTLEMEVLRGLLTERRIETYEAGTTLAPAQQVFCLKICSKIIQSQFCIVLLNNDKVGRVQKTNANVHMEYGLMLGFNKYIIPFQHEDYHLEFNVAGLDTIKYDNTSFKAKATAAIDQAILDTARNSSATAPVSPDVGAYLLLRGAIVSPAESPGDRAIYQLGAVCRFNLCVDFTGNRYRYFGNFPMLQPLVIAWRVKKIVEILEERLKGVEYRVQADIVTAQQRDLLLKLRETMEIWILANDSGDRDEINKLLTGCSATVNVFTVADVSEEVGKSGMY